MPPPSRPRLLIYSFLMVILLLTQVFILVRSARSWLLAELLALVIFVVVILLGFIGYSSRWGEYFFFSAFLLFMIYLLVQWSFSKSLYLIPLLAAILGFALSFPRPPLTETKKKAPEGLHSQVFDTPTRKSSPLPTATYSPGKYVASTRSNQYHQPKCDWAKKIAPGHQVWFANKEEAWKKGYRKHSCVTK